MKILQSESTNRLYVVCNSDGRILEVLMDDFDVIDEDQLPVEFSDIITAESFEKAVEFWKDIRNNEFVNDVELYLKRNEQEPVPMQFTAGNFKTNVWVIASTRKDAVENILREMMQINNEQQNHIRMAEKKLSEQKEEGRPHTFDEFDEISKVNNELINAQRKLVKQNAEISRLNSQLRDSNQQLEHFAYTVSHDLKEPLRMVKSFMDLLSKHYGDQLDEKARKYIYFAADGAERMDAFIKDLLDYSRIGRVGNKVEDTDFAGVLEEVVRMNQSILEETGGSVEWDDLPVIPAQKMAIRQLFNNLISNGLKYRKKEVPPTIQISCEEKKGYWQFSVKDNGRGIDSEHHKAIFELFKRVGDAETEQGTGMGLALCKKIAEQHGGKIWVDSEEGMGSTFHFTIEKTPE